MGDLSLLSHLCIYSVIYISMNSWIFILYFGLSFNTIIVQIAPPLAIGNSVNWLLCPFGTLETTSGIQSMNLNLSSDIYKLCDLGQVTFQSLNSFIYIFIFLSAFFCIIVPVLQHLMRSKWTVVGESLRSVFGIQ